jgi:hypothetical protein
MNSPIQIRRTVYRDKPGFLICGGGRGIFGLRVFTPSRHRAELLKRAYKSNLPHEEQWALTSLILCSPRLAKKEA